jgi:flagellin
LLSQAEDFHGEQMPSGEHLGHDAQGWEAFLMAMDINTNIDALNALRNLGTTSTAFSSSVSKLSSGLRINTAADDAAGLAIATKLQSQVTGLDQAQRNAQDGVSMVQTAEGALNQVQTMLQRIRELAVEAANSTLGQSDAQSVNAEITALQAEITRTATSTTFNNLHLLDGSLSGTGNFTQSGGTAVLGATVDANSSLTNVNVSGAAASSSYTLSSVTGGAGTLTLKNNTTNVSQTITVSANTVSGGAPASQVLNFSLLGVSLTVTSPTTTDTAAAIAGGLDGKTITTGAASAWGAQFQIGANQSDTLGLSFGDARDGALGVHAGDFSTAIANFSTAAASGTSAQVAAAAGALITASDAAINSVSTMNSQYGAVENRLNDTVATLSVTSENLNASESRIKDLNVAAEMVNFTKTQILQQAGTAILAQANAAPQDILTLLK